MTRKAKRRVTFFVVTVVAAYALALVGARLTYRSFLFPAPPKYPDTVPADAKLLTTKAADGTTVNAIAFAAPSDDAPVVVHFHGNGETSLHNAWVARELRRRGLGVVLAEYRGYGLSTGGGAPTEDGLYADATAVLDALDARGVDRDRVVLFGQSLGTGVAVEMAARGRGRALVLVTPYTSIPDMGRHLVPLLPAGLLVGDRFDTLAKAPRLTLPALVVHGDADELIPLEMGRRVASALPNATLLVVNGGHHGDLLVKDAARVFDAIAALARGTSGG